MRVQVDWGDRHAWDDLNNLNDWDDQHCQDDKDDNVDWGDRNDWSDCNNYY